MELPRRVWYLFAWSKWPGESPVGHGIENFDPLVLVAQFTSVHQVLPKSNHRPASPKTSITRLPLWANIVKLGTVQS